jgi:hypothetical protein
MTRRLALVALAAGLLLVGSAWWARDSIRRAEYRQTAYIREYAWQGIEVGTLIFYPVGAPVPAGRYAAVVAFPETNRAAQRILLRGPSGEEPERPELVSAIGPLVVYRTQAGTTNLDLADLAQ